MHMLKALMIFTIEIKSSHKSCPRKLYEIKSGKTYQFNSTIKGVRKNVQKCNMSSGNNG